MQYLLLIHIGPVRDFIASARRSRDLWFGSWLLSELSKAGAQAVAEQESLQSLIFPAPGSMADLAPETHLNVANKIVAHVNGSPHDLGEQVGVKIIERLRAIRKVAYGQIKGDFYREIAEKQVDDLLEYFWVSVPHLPNNDYATARETAEALMAARKVTRNFDQATWGSYVPKSSLDGLRESVIDESKYPRPGTPQEERRRKIAQLYARYGAGPAERLSGVDLLKRHGWRGQVRRFYSTSHVAALPLLSRLSAADKPKVDGYIETLRGLGIAPEALEDVPGPALPAFGRYDGHLLFEERLGEFFEEEARLQEAQKALAKFRKDVFDDRRPIPYYALLRADGDGMGKSIDNQKTPEAHHRLSHTLAGFAGEVDKIVKMHQGSLVYAGGDDVLAFVPLHTVLQCARELASQFRTRLESFPDANGKSPTLSVGIVVAHHIEPLSEALELARRAEETAKQVEGKNALAVTLSKRSGVDRTVKGTWNQLDQRLEWFIQLHRQEAIPDGAAYELRDLARRLGGADGRAGIGDLEEAMREEAIRILKRKRGKRGQEEIQARTLERLRNHIEEKRVSIDQLADELILARQFADAAEQSQSIEEEGR